MCWTISLLINGIAIVSLIGGCAASKPKVIPGSPEFYHSLLIQTQSDLDSCEKDRQECEEECDATTPYYK